jgi:hypothetical protein
MQHEFGINKWGFFGTVGIVLLFNTYTLFYIWAPFGMPGAGGWARENPIPIVNGFSEL